MELRNVNAKDTGNYTCVVTYTGADNEEPVEATYEVRLRGKNSSVSSILGKLKGLFPQSSRYQDTYYTVRVVTACGFATRGVWTRWRRIYP